MRGQDRQRINPASLWLSEHSRRPLKGNKEKGLELFFKIHLNYGSYLIFNAFRGSSY